MDESPDFEYELDNLEEGSFGAASGFMNACNTDNATKEGHRSVFNHSGLVCPTVIPSNTKDPLGDTNTVYGKRLREQGLTPPPADTSFLTKQIQYATNDDPISSVSKPLKLHNDSPTYEKLSRLVARSAVQTLRRSSSASASSAMSMPIDETIQSFRHHDYLYTNSTYQQDDTRHNSGKGLLDSSGQQKRTYRYSPPPPEQFASWRRVHLLIFLAVFSLFSCLLTSFYVLVRNSQLTNRLNSLENKIGRLQGSSDGVGEKILSPSNAPDQISNNLRRLEEELILRL